MSRRVTPRAYPKPGSMVRGYAYKGPITFDQQYGRLASGSFPADCIEACSASGSVDDAVEFWVRKLQFAESISTVRDLAIRYLREFGAWDDLTEASDETLAQRILWTACCDIHEQGEWFGLAH